MLGAELRKAREAKGLTQMKLCHLTGVDMSYLSNLENDQQSPTLDMLFRICGVLGVSPHVVIARVERHMKRAGLTDLAKARALARTQRPTRTRRKPAK